MTVFMDGCKWQGCLTNHVSIEDCQYYTISFVKIQVYLTGRDLKML